VTVARRLVPVIVIVAMVVGVIVGTRLYALLAGA
jgi:hypothetical protein